MNSLSFSKFVGPPGCGKADDTVKVERTASDQKNERKKESIRQNKRLCFIMDTSWLKVMRLETKYHRPFYHGRCWEKIYTPLLWGSFWWHWMVVFGIQLKTYSQSNTHL